MVKQLFVVNDVAAFAATFAEAKAGKLGFLTIADGTLAPVVGGTIDATATVAVALKDKLSVDLKLGDLQKTVKAAYSAGTAQVSKVTLAAPAGEQKYIKLIDVTIGTANVPTKSFEGTNAAAVVALITAEGAKEDSPFYGYTASAAAEVVSVTAPVGKIFRLAASEGSTIAYSGAGTAIPALPEGTPAVVAKLENDCNIFEGVTNQVGFPVIKPASEVVSTNTYDMLYCDFLVSKPTKDGSRTNSLEKVKLIFAVKTSGTVTVDAIKAEIGKLAYGTTTVVEAGA